MTRIALIRLSALGDVVHTWPLAEGLRECSPTLHLTWVVEEALRDLVEGHPAVDQVITVATKRWRHSPLSSQTRAEIAHLRKQFGDLRADICLDPQGVVKSAIIARACGAATRIGLARPWRRELLAGCAYTEVIPGSLENEHVVATNLEFSRVFGTTPLKDIPVPDGSWLKEKWQESPRILPEGRSYAVLLPAAGHPKKTLDIETLSSIASSIARSAQPVLVVWGPGEQKRAEAIVEASAAGVELAPPTNLLQLGQLVDQASLVIGGDTGPVHLAASLGTPTLAVFLSTNWRRNGPLGIRTGVISATADDPTPTSGSARAVRIRDVSAEEVVEAALSLLARNE